MQNQMLNQSSIELLYNYLGLVLKLELLCSRMQWYKDLSFSGFSIQLSWPNSFLD